MVFCLLIGCELPRDEAMSSVSVLPRGLQPCKIECRTWQGPWGATPSDQCTATEWRWVCLEVARWGASRGSGLLAHALLPSSGSSSCLSSGPRSLLWHPLKLPAPKRCSSFSFHSSPQCLTSPAKSLQWPLRRGPFS